MEPNAPLPEASAAPGITGTRTPSAVAFITGILLFLLPFVEIKCNNMSLASVSGVQLATGFKVKSPGSGSLLDNTGSDEVTQRSANSGKNGPNLFALVALVLGVVGTALAFTSSRSTLYVAMAAAVGSAASLIGLFIDLKQKTSKGLLPSGTSGKGDGGMDDFGNSLNESIKVTLDFTPWFYVAVAAFGVAAYLCFRRVKAMSLP